MYHSCTSVAIVTRQATALLSSQSAHGTCSADINNKTNTDAQEEPLRTTPTAAEQHCQVWGLGLCSLSPDPFRSPGNKEGKAEPQQQAELWRSPQL